MSNVAAKGLIYFPFLSASLYYLIHAALTAQITAECVSESVAAQEHSGV